MKFGTQKLIERKIRSDRMKVSTVCELCKHKGLNFKKEKPNNLFKIKGKIDICHSCYMNLSFCNNLSEDMAYVNFEYKIVDKNFKFIFDETENVREMNIR